MANALPELDVLVPRHPSLDSNTDEWPELTLNNAFVHLPGDKNALTNLLEAAASYPLTVVGELEPLDEDDAELYLETPGPHRKSIPITLENVRMFSYGQLTDGRTCVWAAGRAGWYTVNPSRKYRKIHDQMCEAVEVLYFIADAYRHERTEGRGKNKRTLPDYTIQELFAKYASDQLTSDNASDGEDIIYKHKNFLITSMLEGKEGLAWRKYPLYKHLHKRFPDTFAELKKRRQIPPKKAEGISEETKKSTNARKPSVDTQSIATTSRTSKSRRTGQNSMDARSVPAKDGSNTDTTVLTRRTRRTGKGGEVEITSLDEPSDGTASANHNPRVKSESPLPEAMATPSRDESSDEDMGARAQKNKSSLRPRASKASKSASRRGTKAPAIDTDDENSEVEPISSPINGKRRHVDEDDDQHRQLKRRSSRSPAHEDDEGIDIPTSPEGASATSSPAADASMSDLPVRLLQIAHRPDPVQEDTWICALDGCAHKVYAASTSDSQRLIREHYALHAYDDDDRVKMVKKLQAPSLPVSRLMDRVKLQAKKDGFPASTAAIPMPDQVKSRFARPGVIQQY
jgi:hypothetical protein